MVDVRHEREERVVLGLVGVPFLVLLELRLGAPLHRLEDAARLGSRRGGWLSGSRIRSGERGNLLVLEGDKKKNTWKATKLIYPDNTPLL